MRPSSPNNCGKRARLELCGDFIEFDSSPTWLRHCGLPGPIQKVQERLLGDWTSTDGKEKMKVRKLDESVYIVYYDGDLFRAYHSDIAETPFASVQDLKLE